LVREGKRRRSNREPKGVQTSGPQAEQKKRESLQPFTEGKKQQRRKGEKEGHWVRILPEGRNLSLYLKRERGGKQKGCDRKIKKGNNQEFYDRQIRTVTGWGGGESWKIHQRKKGTP